MPLPTCTCPNCRITASLDVFLSEDSVREALDAVIDAHPAGDTLIKPMLRYVGLFAPAKSKMAYSRMAALIAEITPAMRAAQIQRGGRIWPAPLEYWWQGFEAVLAQAHVGGLVLPLKSHNYLLEIIARMSSKEEGQRERAVEQQRAGPCHPGSHQQHTTPADAGKRARNPAGLAPAETYGVINMATKKKAKAAQWVCQSKEMTIESIRTLGDTQRELTRIETEINDQIAAITASRKDEIDTLKTRIDTLAGGIQTWCEAHRVELLANGGKEANLITGLVKWRQRPPSVSIRSVDKVLEALRSLGLGRFIRSKEEPNKEAMLADPKSVSGIVGINIVTGVEDFVIEPFEVDIAKD